MEIEEILKKLSPTPAGVTDWIIKEAVENTYIIYNRKTDEAVCTRCGHKFKASRFKMVHNDTGICPGCKSEATYKASGRGRDNLTEYFRVMLFTHRGNTVYGTLTEIVAKFTNVGKPNLKKWISEVYVFNEKEQIRYKHYSEWTFGTVRWKEIKSIKLPQPSATVCYNSEPRFSRTILYEKNLEKVFLNSCLKYQWDPEYFKEYECDAYDMVKYISFSLKYQSIELLRKAGFKMLVCEKTIESPGSGCVNWRGKSLSKILRMSKGDVRKLQGHDPGFVLLSFYQGLSEKERRLPLEVIKKLSDIQEYRKAEIEEHISLVKWATWASEEQAEAHDWLDYIRDCKLLGLDIRKKSVLLPKNFINVHQELARKVKVNEDEFKRKAMQKYAEQYALNISDEMYILKIACSQTDLNNESSELGHCVRTYGDKVSEGRTLIYFIRKKDEPDKPFYTLEIKPDGKFVQCRGKSNCSMTDEVKAFTEMVIMEFKKMIKKKARDAA